MDLPVVETKNIRNVALLGHGGAGKTTLAEAMLFVSGAVDRMGKVTDGNTVCDYDPEEKSRGFSLSSAIAPVMWQNMKLNIIDNPGFLDFVGEVKQGLRVADAACIVLDGKAGLEVGAELAWDYATEVHVPKSFFVNKCDDPEAHFDTLFNALTEKYGQAVCPVFVPIKTAGGVVMVDVMDMVAFTYDDKGNRKPVEMTDEVRSAAEPYKTIFNEAIAMVNEDIMMKVLEDEEVTHDEAAEALHEGIISGDVVPVYCGAAPKLWGVRALLDAIADSYPRFTARKNEKSADGKDLPIDPAGEPAIFVFKTVADPFVGKMSFFKVMNGELKKDAALKNATTGSVEKMAHIYAMRGKTQIEVDRMACGDIGMIAKLSNTNTNDTLSVSGSVSYAPVVYPVPFMQRSIVTLGKGDEGKISQSLARLLEEDKTLLYENNAETKQMLISGLGDMHLQVLVSKLKTRFGVTVRLDNPKIAYREKITKPCDVEGKHKKQNGGSGQYGHVKIRFSPGEEEGLTFVDATVGGSVPKNFIPAVEKGLQEAMLKGVAGYPMVRLKAELYDGSYHAVDSDELSFKTAASLAYKKCLELSAPVILEPVGDLFVTVPDSLVGDVMGDLNKRRSSVMGMTPVEGKSGYTVIQALSPLSELTDYTITLRAMSQGRGSYTFKVTGYDTVPREIAAKIIEESKKNAEE
ncbi:MAG: elongation factor G [Clostridia bacterium]|nr:elongation factor G [Clostridia bacterium]